LDTGTPAGVRDLATASLRWWCLTVLPGARLQTRLCRPNGSGTGEAHSFGARRIPTANGDYFDNIIDKCGAVVRGIIVIINCMARLQSDK